MGRRRPQAGAAPQERKDARRAGRDGPRGARLRTLSPPPA